MQEITPERAAILMAEELHARNNPVFVGIQVGTVTKPLPDIEIQVGEIELDKTQLVFAEYLLQHKRKLKITSSSASLSHSKDAGATSQELDPPYKHSHDIAVANGSFSLSDSDVEYLDELKVGDEVIVMAAQDQQTYYVLDRAVRFE
ncbi:DUF2577 domain-containing protein [Aneurinibacillus aneurinilyticus]|uniref:DUF2577 domain-containing protein n=1 Tax=Aneurinibacillus aneurinilyticus ATCC 12856 TaxID=649747 RepID=U1WW30_ANEAE|nr:DUF2577 domain-containing protein [Aneurinibacillus aneurinilyticus]ERI06458.1 hypothetical protein HMPREF0083_05300 [Aneurinibacillus aneurinilyticus ATCC 12856]MED0707073.1 DUF2577 domain-containing protein [Aneurinibacillus aneurinilyticus]MED0732858.1 DUF2577 domain-containing protein [Aneurinibacillus aneurinilyticus]MED0740372.1 DUF2577 domain-containing protein [Aneurinibacillus aneurinilyticus]